MDDDFDLSSYLTDASQAASAVGSIFGTTKSAAASPATATPATSTAPKSNTTLYLIVGAIGVAVLGAVLILPRLFRR
jgi:hypothetical protein